MKWIFPALFSLALLLLTLAGVEALRLCRFEVVPLAIGGEPGRRLLCVKLDRLTGVVEIGREFTMGPPNGRQMTGFVWEPLEGNAAEMFDRHAAFVFPENAASSAPELSQ